MAKKFEIHYARSLVSDDGSCDMTIDQMKTMVKYSSQIRGVWGEEYVDFHIEEDTIYPICGSFNLLGYAETGKKVAVKDYSFEEFIEMLKSTSATEFALTMTTPEGPVQSRELSKIFNRARISRFTDYSKIVTDLEERGWLITCPSQNILRTDERRFTLSPHVEDVCSSLKEYIGEMYEVDSLGTGFWTELTKGVEKLWDIHLKAASSKQQLDN